jgi:hypothetical protein
MTWLAGAVLVFSPEYSFVLGIGGRCQGTILLREPVVDPRERDV